MTKSAIIYLEIHPKNLTYYIYSSRDSLKRSTDDIKYVILEKYKNIDNNILEIFTNLYIKNSYCDNQNEEDEDNEEDNKHFLAYLNVINKKLKYYFNSDEKNHKNLMNEIEENYLNRQYRIKYYSNKDETREQRQIIKNLYF
jgi:hypothetical protein